ncbi:MAG: hypothetical protein K2R98_30410 [Gemmataceae bacterium]|nr:hypothetical protein [Gemmataceae bacterium]
MKRILIGALFFVAVGLVSGSVAQAQDKVSYYDRKAKKDDVKTGEITAEDPAKITVKGLKDPIPAADVQDVSYAGRNPIDRRKTYNDAIASEAKIEKAGAGAARKKAIEDTIQAYTAAQADYKAHPAATRHLEYKVARLTARLAGEDASQRKSAIALLAKFKKDHPSSWQIIGCVQKLADLQIEAEDFKGAVASLKDLQDMKTLPDDVRARLPRLMVEVLVKSKDFTAAASQIEGLLKNMKKDDPDFFPLTVMKLQMEGNVKDQLEPTVKKFEGLIKDTKGNDKLAVCYNSLGNLYLANNRPKEALYQFLYVDLVYNDNKDEQARACAELAKLFEKIKQPSRAKEYADKAEKLKK